MWAEREKAKNGKGAEKIGNVRLSHMHKSVCVCVYVRVREEAEGGGRDS